MLNIQNQFIFFLAIIFSCLPLSAQEVIPRNVLSSEIINCTDGLERYFRQLTHQTSIHKEENGVLVFFGISDGCLRANGWVSVRPPEKILREIMDYAVFDQWKCLSLDEDCLPNDFKGLTIVAPLDICHPLKYGKYGSTMFRDDAEANELIKKYLNNSKFHIMAPSDFTGLFTAINNQLRSEENIIIGRLK